MEKILIVDDNPKNIQLLGNILSEKNYEIEYAQDGLEAVEIVESEDFDLILMDVMMPEMDGYEACKKIKAMKSKSEIPLIFITAKIDSDSITRGFDVGGVDYITKPFNASELIARVETHIALKISRDKIKGMNKELKKKVEERTRALRESNIKLDKANKELEDLDVAKNDFLHIISHEIRTPLNGILGFIDLIKTESEDESILEMVDALDKSSKRLEDFSFNALDISNIYTKGDEVLTKEKISVRETIEDMLTALRFENKTINPIFETKLDSGFINCDVHYFQKCFKIIISNALSHSLASNPVTISGKKDENSYIISVKDTGKGFPDLLTKKGIKAFNSSEHVDHNPGLDLYLCKLIIEAHNGTISLKNENGGKVEITIPCN